MHRNSLATEGTVGRLTAWALGLLVALVGIGTTSVAFGQNAGDPPGRVARLGDAEGTVWLYSAERNEWVAIGRNQPITGGDRIATDEGAHAELALGSTTVRVDAATELEVERLDDRVFRVRLVTGSVVAGLHSPQAFAEFALVTDEGRFTAQGVGLFRFDRDDDASDLTVYRGQATFERADSALVLGAGQHARFWLDAAGAAQYRTAEPAHDAFAAWSEQRDRTEAQAPAVRYVSPEMTGAADLERYGNWEQSEEYGPVWYPRDVAADWAPYSTGHWSYVRPWGWTWVDAAPWGFAPFHYGRWVRRRDAWGWAPGRYVARPVYAPALVAWVGGAGFGASVSRGRLRPPVGWFPLAPREVYVPSYRTSPIYVRNINFTHVQDATRIDRVVAGRDGGVAGRDFSNRKFPHAITVVPANVLADREPVGPAAARLRADPQGRALFTADRAAGVMLAAPVAAPAPRAAGNGRRRLPPPFAGRPLAVGPSATPEPGQPLRERRDNRDSRIGAELRPTREPRPGTGSPRRERGYPPAGFATQPAPVSPPGPGLQPIQPVRPIEPVRSMRANPIRPIAPVRPQDTNPIQPIQPVQPLQPARPVVVPGRTYEAAPEGGFRGRRRGPDEARGSHPPPSGSQRSPSIGAPRDIGERRFNRPDAPARMQSQDDRGGRERQR